MPYKDPAKQREYQKLRIRKTRSDWLRINGGCVKCGSKEELEVDHIDPSTKISHNIWSWSIKRREEELKKCQVLCKKCHKKKTIKYITKPLIHGTRNAYSHKGCRCNKCREVASNAVIEWRKRTGRR